MNGVIFSDDSHRILFDIYDRNTSNVFKSFSVHINRLIVEAQKDIDTKYDIYSNTFYSNDKNICNKLYIKMKHLEYFNLIYVKEIPSKELDKHIYCTMFEFCCSDFTLFYVGLTNEIPETKINKVISYINRDCTSPIFYVISNFIKHITSNKRCISINAYKLFQNENNSEIIKEKDLSKKYRSLIDIDDKIDLYFDNNDPDPLIYVIGEGEILKYKKEESIKEWISRANFPTVDKNKNVVFVKDLDIVNEMVNTYGTENMILYYESFYFNDILIKAICVNYQENYFESSILFIEVKSKMLSYKHPDFVQCDQYLVLLYYLLFFDLKKAGHICKNADIINDYNMLKYKTYIQ